MHVQKLPSTYCIIQTSKNIHLVTKSLYKLLYPIRRGKVIEDEGGKGEALTLYDYSIQGTIFIDSVGILLSDTSPPTVSVTVLTDTRRLPGGFKIQ